MTFFGHSPSVFDVKNQGGGWVLTHRRATPVSYNYSVENMVATGGQVCTFAANTSTLPLPVGTLVEPPLGLLTATMVMYNLIFEP